MAQSLYRKYFEIVPVNNITAFQVNNGTDQISFLIPPLNGATLSTRDLVFSGRFELNKDDGTAYSPTDYGTTDVSWDSVNGAHNLISRVDIVSQGSGNSLIEQRRNYSLINKYRRGTLSKNDLVAGKYNNQHLCGNSSAAAQNFFGRAAANGLSADQNAFDFAIQLNTGFLMDNIQPINLGAANGILIKLYLNEIPNAIFNIDPGAVSVANNNYNIVLKNVKMFGRYNFVSQQLLAQLSGVQFRKINDLISVVQSSNDTLANQPMVRSMHKMVHIYQPNTSTSNNINANNTSTNQIVGLKKYIVSNNGSRHPYNYDIEITPSISQLPATAGNSGRVAGNAEQIYLLIGALNSQYPPIHSLVNAENQAKAHEDSVDSDNESTLNVDAIAVDYSYGYAGFSVPMTNNLLQLNVESSLLTNDAIVPTGERDQTATQNAFIEYDASLTYQGMQIQQ
jgi:hypothetical protein